LWAMKLDFSEQVLLLFIKSVLGKCWTCQKYPRLSYVLVLENDYGEHHVHRLFNTNLLSIEC
jgi:hypothetical protein